MTAAEGPALGTRTGAGQSPKQAEPTSERRFCRMCGSPLAAEARFCARCGAENPLPAPDASSRPDGSGARQTLNEVWDQYEATHHAPQADGGTGSLQEQAAAVGSKVLAGAANVGKQVAFSARNVAAGTAAAAHNSAWLWAFRAPKEVQTDKPMLFYKFLVWVSLYASAIANVWYSLQCWQALSALSSVSGLAGMTSNNYTAALCVSLVFLGIGFACLCPYCLRVRGMLAGFKEGAPGEFLRLPYHIAAVVLVCTIPLWGLIAQGYSSYLSYSSYLGSYLFETTFTGVVVALLMQVVITLAQKAYFDRRAELFVN